LALIQSIIAASVVDFPLPVGPVTTTRPLSYWQKSMQALGNLRSSTVKILDGICLKTAPTPAMSRKTLQRMRARPTSS
jgi:hypothetical protein